MTRPSSLAIILSVLYCVECFGCKHGAATHTARFLFMGLIDLVCSPVWKGMELGSRWPLGLGPGFRPKLVRVEVLRRQRPLVFMVCLCETTCV